MAYDAVDLPPENYENIIKELDELIKKMEGSIDILPEEQQPELLFVLDALDDDVAELSEIQEGRKETTISDEKLLELDLQSAIRTLLAEFRPTKIGDLQLRCQKLIEHHGFTQFQETVDALLVQSEQLKNQELRAMKHINRYLMNKMMDTFVAITAEGSSTFAKSILNAFSLNQYYREKALEAEKNDSPQAQEQAIKMVQMEAAQIIAEIKQQELSEEEQQQLIGQANKEATEQITEIQQRAKNMAIKVVQTETAQKIAGIKQQGLPEEEQQQLIEQATKESAEQITAVTQMETIPLDYYIRAERQMFQERVLKAAEEDGYQKAKKLTIKAIQTETAQKIEGIKQQGLPEGEQQQLIEQVNKESAEQVAAVEQMQTMPLDYYIEAARRKILQDSARSRALFQSYDKVVDSVVQDILSRKSMDERTIVMERYLFMAEKLMTQKNYDAAFQIHGALQQTPVYRLAKTKEGLSPHAQKIIERLNELQDNSKNYAALRGRCERENAYIPLNFTVTDITFATDDANPFILDSKGKIVRGCEKLPGMEKIIANCVKAAATTIADAPDPTLSGEIEGYHQQLATKNKKNVENELYDVSQKHEPRNAPPEASSILSKSKLKKLIHLGIIEPPKRSEQTRKLEDAIHDLKERIQGRLEHLKHLVVHYEDKVKTQLSALVDKMQNAITPLFERIGASLKESFQNASQRFRSLMQSSKKEQENEDKEGEHPHF